MLFIFLVIAFAGMDWVTRIQKSLLVLLILAQFDMLIGSFVNTDYGKLNSYVYYLMPLTSKSALRNF